MFQTETNADETVSRRSVLETTGGLVTGVTALASLGAGRGAAETEDGLQFDVREFTEEYVVVEVTFPDETHDGVAFPNDVFLGHAERFVLHEDGEWVSLPDETSGLATPVAGGWERVDERRYVGYFRTAEVDLSEATGEEVVLGLGLFPERTVPVSDWATCPGHRDY